MSQIKTYYLIDFENVGTDGLSGCAQLKNTAHILIFFTNHAKKIDMSTIANHGAANLEMIEVPAGKQSTDIHIGSYLGYLAGTKKATDCTVVIVSMDTDFDNVIKFWQEKTGVKALRVQKIRDHVSATVPTVKAEETHIVVTKKKSPKATPENRTKLNVEIQKVLSAAKYDNKTIGAVASLTVSHFGEDQMLASVQKELRSRFKTHADIYATIRSIVARYDGTPDPGPNKTEVNAAIQQILSKAGMDNEITTGVASLVVKNIGVKNGKQQIYRSIISKYGQKKGLDIYKRVKNYIS